ncbi:17447_t:CDS:2 [Cetraspora pellucida]|uniref:17447_t:CDS:1 n=1 Tax=Cetraspora pellucida TaxID=1433469 RepID=A0ACA9PHJ7_9GLOM|nr:17447_t:CDS:2 [Cetraspora pellucida]
MNNLKELKYKHKYKNLKKEKNKLEAKYEEELEELTEKIIALKIENKEFKDKFYTIEKLKKNQKSYTCCDDMSFMTMKKAKKLELKVKSVKENEYCMGVDSQSKIERVSFTMIKFEDIKFLIHFEIGNKVVF